MLLSEIISQIQIYSPESNYCTGSLQPLTCKVLRIWIKIISILKSEWDFVITWYTQTNSMVF